jgi:hypothetical protein
MDDFETISGDRLEMLHKHILDMAKPIAMLRKQSAGY